MTKSTDKSLIEDTEIPTEDLVEDLVEDETSSKTMRLRTWRMTKKKIPNMRPSSVMTTPTMMTTMTTR
jgi:hypothetical protein